MNYFPNLFQSHDQQIKTVIGDMIIYTKGGKVHREDGPAVMTSWSQEWYLNGISHRSDGPAKLYLKHPMPRGDEAVAANGELIAEWHRDGKYHFQTVFRQEEKDGFMQYWHEEIK